MRRALGWSAGATVCALPLVAAIRNQRHVAFWVMIILVAGAAACWGAHRPAQSAHPQGVGREWNSGPVLFVAIYPVGIIGGLLLDNLLTRSLREEVSPVAALVGLAIAAAMATMPIAIVRRPNAHQWLRRLARFWAVMTAVFILYWGVGLAFLPLALGYRRAARSQDHPSAPSPIDPATHLTADGPSAACIDRIRPARGLR